MRLLHFADVHLGASFGSFGQLAESRRRETADALLRLPDLAASHAVDAVVVAGDLFDGPRPGPDDLAAARRVLRRFVEDGRAVFVVPGNHDSHLFQPNPYRDGFGAAHVLTSATLDRPVRAETDSGSLFVYGAAFDPAVEPDPLSTFRREEADGTHVVLLHGSVRDAPHWRGSAATLRLEADRLAALEADYIALGDYHRHRPPSEFDPPCAACYCGSFAALDMTETGPHGPVLVELGDGAPRVELLDQGVSPVVDVGEIDVSAIDDETTLVERIFERAGETAVPTVTLVGEPSLPLTIESISEPLIARYGHAVVRDRTTIVSSSRLDELAAQDTLAGHVARRGRSRIESAVTDRDRLVADRALRIALRALGAAR